MIRLKLNKVLLFDFLQEANGRPMIQFIERTSLTVRFTWATMRKKRNKKSRQRQRTVYNINAHVDNNIVYLLSNNTGQA